MPRDVLQEFTDFNRPFAQRNADLLRVKVARMAEGPFAFFRGTFHLFARDVLDRGLVPLPLFTGAGSEMDLVGDLHAENYGAFKAEDGDVHYDVNDFDETTRGRFDFDLCRLATSWLLAAQEQSAPLADAVHVALAGISAYTAAVHRLLKKGKDRDLDVRATDPSGCRPVDDLLAAGAAARRTVFIDRLTEYRQGQRRLHRSVRYFNLPPDEHDRAERLLASYLRNQDQEKEAKDYYAIEDVCGRVSGIGSMGRFRYAVLVAGKGNAEAKNLLLEFKEARPSAYDLYRRRDTDAAALLARAARVIEVQRLSQAATNRHLGHATDGPLSFQVRELGPQDARLDPGVWKTAAVAEGVAKVQANILARIHARAAARAVGVANPLAELAEAEAFCQRVLSFTLGYADVARRDWQLFAGARAQLDDVSKWADSAPSPSAASARGHQDRA
jgi:uncharacterized protein (DUF2252 family)